MSSKPFCLCLPVVNELPTQSGDYILRSKDEQDLSRKVQKLQNELTKGDLIMIYYIGYRPDKSFPVARFFAEIYVGLGEAMEWHLSFSKPWNYTLYHRIATGVNERK